ncbi:hypothetical protein PoB_002247800 [Plakobranchus ocellatus]|uniref:Uncharacterized protein n=1 Tax=Plakobranchus ocellatus TaxID=259542 RepID=A0AAV3ZMA4_9GAST|nr:hypothetical protein PoB_002247800 [Plakobranchus ocellatus]
MSKGFGDFPRFLKTKFRTTLHSHHMLDEASIVVDQRHSLSSSCTVVLTLLARQSGDSAISYSECVLYRHATTLLRVPSLCSLFCPMRVKMARLDFGLNTGRGEAKGVCEAGFACDLHDNRHPYWLCSVGR